MAFTFGMVVGHNSVRKKCWIDVQFLHILRFWHFPHWLVRLCKGVTLLPAPFKIWPSAPRSTSFLYHCSPHWLCVLPKLFLPSPCSPRFLKFAPWIFGILASEDRSKYAVYCWWKSKMEIRKLTERSEAKKNPENHVRFFETLPRIFCSLLP